MKNLIKSKSEYIFGKSINILQIARIIGRAVKTVITREELEEFIEGIIGGEKS